MTPDDERLKQREYQRAWYARNKDRVNARNRERARANYDPVRARELREKKKDKLKAYRVANRDREIARAKEWYANNKDRARDTAREKRFGLTPADVQSLLTAQGNACAICATSFADLPARHLHIDHCHATGKVRGLLCHHCNVALGCFDDSPATLIRAAAYLEAAR